MIIQCVGCGFSKHLDPKGTAEELEARINQTVAIEGWRYSNNYKGYVCPKCCKSGGDPLLVAFQGKIRKTSKEKSYLRLLYDFTDFVRTLRGLEDICK